MRNTKILESKLGSNGEILHRINLRCASFAKYKEIWRNNKHLSTHTNVRVYQSLIVPIIMYNSSTLAVTQATFEKYDTAHWKHMKQILNINWPATITNKKL